jgi:hypothetical protein
MTAVQSQSGTERRVSPRVIGEYLAVAGLAGFVGWLDYVTGPDFSIILFYALLVAWIAWRTSFRGALIGAVALTAVWVYVNLVMLGLSAGVSVETKAWNGLMVLGIFVAFALALNRLKSAHTAQQRLNAQLQSALSELNVLEGLVPICAWCKSIRIEDATWVSIEAFISSSQGSPQLTHSICPKCEKKVSPGDSGSSR